MTISENWYVIDTGNWESVNTDKEVSDYLEDFLYGCMKGD